MRACTDSGIGEHVEAARRPARPGGPARSAAPTPGRNGRPGTPGSPHSSPSIDRLADQPVGLGEPTAEQGQHGATDQTGITESRLADSSRPGAGTHRVRRGTPGRRFRADRLLPAGGPRAAPRGRRCSRPVRPLRRRARTARGAVPGARIALCWASKQAVSVVPSPLARAAATACSASSCACATSTRCQASTRARLAVTRRRSSLVADPPSASSASESSATIWSGGHHMRLPIACKPSAARASPGAACSRRASSAARRYASAGRLPVACPPPRLGQLDQCLGPHSRALAGRSGQRPLPVVHGLFVGQPAGRLPRRGHAVAARPGRAGVGLHEVPGQLGQRDITAVRPVRLEFHTRSAGAAGPGPRPAAPGMRTRGTGRARTDRPSGSSWLSTRARTASASNPVTAPGDYAGHPGHQSRGNSRSGDGGGPQDRAARFRQRRETLLQGLARTRRHARRGRLSATMTPAARRTGYHQYADARRRRRPRRAAHPRRPRAAR